MKFSSIISTVAVLGLIVTGVSFASANSYMNHNGNNNHMGAMSQLSTEQQSQYNDMRDSNYDKMRPIHRELQAKELELRALSNNSNTSPKDISKLAKEVSNLYNEIEDNKIAFSENVESAFGIEYSNYGNCNGRRGSGMMNGGNGHRGNGMMHGGNNGSGMMHNANGGNGMMGGGHSNR